jgi:hypothetical protein
MTYNHPNPNKVKTQLQQHLFLKKVFLNEVKKNSLLRRSNLVFFHVFRVVAETTQDQACRGGL